MSRTVITAILLDDLLREGHEICLPADALVTPAARDWLKEHPVPVIWQENGVLGAGRLGVVMDSAPAELRLVRTILDRQGVLSQVVEPLPGRTGMVNATRDLCDRIVQREIARGVVFAQDGALPVCIANKHGQIRAALGVNVPMVEEACRSLGLNVLVLEYPTLTPYQMKQMVERLMKSPVSPPADTAAAIEVLEQGTQSADR